MAIRESNLAKNRNFAESAVFGKKILLYTKDYKKEGEVQCVPAYFTWLL